MAYIYIMCVNVIWSTLYFWPWHTWISEQWISRISSLQHWNCSKGWGNSLNTQDAWRLISLAQWWLGTDRHSSQATFHDVKPSNSGLGMQGQHLVLKILIWRLLKKDIGSNGEMLVHYYLEKGHHSLERLAVSNLPPHKCLLGSAVNN